RRHLAHARANILPWWNAQPMSAKARDYARQHIAAQGDRFPLEILTYLRALERLNMWAMLETMDDERRIARVEEIADELAELLSPISTELRSPQKAPRAANPRMVADDLLVRYIVDFHRKAHGRVPTCSSVGSEGATYKGQFPTLAELYLEAF